MDRALFLSRIRDRLGLPGSEDAAPVALAVLSVIGEGLSKPVAQTVAVDLPGELGRALLGARHAAPLGAKSFRARVAKRARLSLPRADEAAIVVCETLAEALRPEMVELLRGDLPAAVARRIRWPEAVPPADYVQLDPLARTLAEGRPGSSHPLSTSRPEVAQSESVARSDNPHGQTKLSSAAGLTQEREGETLAEGRPGARPTRARR